MPSTLALTSTVPAVRALPGPAVRARLALYGAPGEPPVVEELADGDAAVLIERLCDAVADRSPLPAPAVREVVENLVHAGFRDATVSVLDGGALVRVTDHGPGIPDPARALAPGFSAAGPRERELVRGVGCGLPLARDLMAAAGGGLEIAANLGGGAAVTLSAAPPGAATAGAPEPACSEAAREILALLLEVGAATPEALAHELGRPRAECGRELALLQHRALVVREPGGARRLTDAGAALVATLF
jgi:Histidine kinase-, DNA gyrase B-, and HSP90-like ATPase